MEFRQQLARALAPLKHRLQLMIGRAVIHTINDSSQLQTLQLGILAGELKEPVERLQEYGFTSHPKPGAEAVVLFHGGNRDHGLVIAVDDVRYRLKQLKAGEVALYDDLGNRIHLARGGVYIKAVTALKVDAPQSTWNGNLAINGQLTATEDISAAGISLKGHKHSGDSGGTTGGPQ